MNRRIPKAPNRLRIWQQNSHKSKLAQQYILNTAPPEDWDVIAIQEPWLDQFKNARGSSYWRILYPTTHLLDNAPRTRSILMINTNIATDSYIQLDVPNADITAVRFNGVHGNISLFNIYNDCTHNETLSALHLYLLANPPFPLDSMLWLGDFNRHHPLWESADNHHLNSSEEDLQTMLDLIRDHDMSMALPSGIPTYESAIHSWTRPDNVWLSHQALNLLISCNTEPSIRPINVDHLPIVTCLDMPVLRVAPNLLPDFHNMDIETFNMALQAKLTNNSPAHMITSMEAFHTKVDQVMAIIQETIQEQILIRKPCPFSK